MTRLAALTLSPLTVKTVLSMILWNSLTSLATMKFKFLADAITMSMSQSKEAMLALFLNPPLKSLKMVNSDLKLPPRRVTAASNPFRSIQLIKVWVVSSVWVESLKTKSLKSLANAISMWLSHSTMPTLVMFQLMLRMLPSKVLTPLQLSRKMIIAKSFLLRWGVLILRVALSSR